MMYMSTIFAKTSRDSYLLPDICVGAGDLAHQLVRHFEQTLLLSIHHIVIRTVPLNWLSTAHQHFLQVRLRHVDSPT